MKLSTLTWIDEHIFDQFTYKMWDISQWFFNRNHVKISDFFESIERKVSHKWTRYLLKRGWKPKPMSEDSKKFLKATLGSYLDCVKKGI